MAVAVGAVCALLATTAVSTVVGLVGGDLGWTLPGVLAADVSLAVAWRSYRRRLASDLDSVWDVTPRW